MGTLKGPLLADRAHAGPLDQPARSPDPGGEGAVTCSHLEPGRNPQPCGKPAVVVYAGKVAEPPARCARHAPTGAVKGQSSFWKPVVA